jgi:hypothetical protein
MPDGPGMVVGPIYLQAPAYDIVSITRNPVTATCKVGGTAGKHGLHCCSCRAYGLELAVLGVI